MEGEGDGFRSERWRVREKMEGNRALQKSGSRFKMCLRKKKKNKGIAQKKLKTDRSMAACITHDRSSIQKNADIGVKNAALDVS